MLKSFKPNATVDVVHTSFKPCSKVYWAIYALFFNFLFTVVLPIGEMTFEGDLKSLKNVVEYITY